MKSTWYMKFYQRHSFGRHLFSSTLFIGSDILANCQIQNFFIDVNVSYFLSLASIQILWRRNIPEAVFIALLRSEVLSESETVKKRDQHMAFVRIPISNCLSSFFLFCLDMCFLLINIYFQSLVNSSEYLWL